MKDRNFIEWDKDDIDALGLMKVDVLALGMLTCIRKAYDMMREQGIGDYDLEGRYRFRRPCGLRHAVPGREPWRVSGRKPRADEHATAHETALSLRPYYSGGDCPARADSG